jgi:hypothetical protein
VGVTASWSIGGYGGGEDSTSWSKGGYGGGEDSASWPKGGYGGGEDSLLLAYKHIYTLLNNLSVSGSRRTYLLPVVQLRQVFLN